ncbi:sugar ABC transporter permease [Cytobacillus firmus]|uniref:ABC transporter permease n=1 Tax=Paenibacillus lautus TaxID=1401 RepID=UPI0010D4B5BC|nr:sugar ABC transporter permease [Cytobacillus firmus]VTR47155.1 sn-glycerol-3-phosphate transport system permease protein ugpA [Actinobacillus pleuropneumoniae]
MKANTEYVLHKPPIRVRMRTGFKRMLNHWPLYILILPPIIYIAIFNYVPMYGVLLAFKQYLPLEGIIGSPWVGFSHFEQFFSSPSSWRIIKNTILISIYSLVAGFPLPILLAVALNEVRIKWFKKTVQMLTYAPYFISSVVLVGIVMQILDPRIGLINQFIQLFGGESINFMGDPQSFRSIYVWMGIWQGTGYGAIIYLAALAGVSKDLQEACIIDGASKIRRIWHVDLPSIRPTIVILLVLNVGGIMSVGFETIYLMQNNLNLSVSEIISTYVYKVGLINSNYGFSTAIGLFNSVINLILLIIANFTARKLTDSGLW